MTNVSLSDWSSPLAALALVLAVMVTATGSSLSCRSPAIALSNCRAIFQFSRKHTSAASPPAAAASASSQSVASSSSSSGWPRTESVSSWRDSEMLDSSLPESASSWVTLSSTRSSILAATTVGVPPSTSLILSLVSTILTLSELILTLSELILTLSEVILTLSATAMQEAILQPCPAASVSALEEEGGARSGCMRRARRVMVCWCPGGCPVSVSVSHPAII